MRALLVGLFAFVLVTQAAAAAMQGESTPAPRKANVERPALTLDQQLERKLAALRKYRGTVRFFENHRSLLASSGEPAKAKTSLAYARTRVRQLTKSVAALRAKVVRARGDRLAKLPPRKAICPSSGPLRGGARGLVVRVPAQHERPERPVPRPLPDGLVRATPVRPRLDRARPGARRAPVLRALGPRLEPVELQLGGVLASTSRGPARRAGLDSQRPSLFVANCTPARSAAGFVGPVLLLGVP